MKRENPRNIVNMNEKPFVHPAVNDAAASYLAGREARKNQLTKTNVPVAGGESPSIPRLDQPVVANGMTMEQMAKAASSQIVQPSGGPQLQVQLTDLLPDEAQSDPAFIPGSTSMYACNQPNLAAKYGVIRNSIRIPPGQLISRTQAQPQTHRQLRPETLNDIRTLEALQKSQESEAPNILQNDSEAEERVSDGIKAAADIGMLPSGRDEPRVNSDINMDEFEFDSWRRAMMKDILNNPDQKDIIESRLSLMDIGDFVTQGFIIQRVPIIPKRFEPSFRTTSGETDLALKRLIMEDAKTIEMSDRYYLDKFAMMSMAALLHSINGKPLPEYTDSNGNFNDEMFKAKFSRIIKLPLQMLASLGVNALWFDIRVRKLFVVEKVSNG